MTFSALCRETRHFFCMVRENLPSLTFRKKKYSKESFQLRDSYDENHNGKKNVKKPIGLTELVTDRMRDGQFVRPLLIALFVQSFVHLDDWVRLSLNKFEDSLETKNKRNDEMMRRVYGWI